MVELMGRWNSWLGKRMFYVVLSALFIGFNTPLPQLPIFTKIAVVLFAYMSFITALDTSFKQFIKILKEPWIPLWMIFLIHIGAPIVAWIVGWIFYPQDQLIRLGFLISASIPVAVTSIIWTSLTNGNVPLALVVVTLDTLIVPIILPLFFLITVGEVVAIDYQDLILRLLIMVTIPSVVGMFIHDMTQGRLEKFTKTVGGFTSKMAFFMVIFLNAAMVADEFHWDFTMLKLLSVVLLLVIAGYALGYLGYRLLKGAPSGVLSAMLYNVGMRNISFGTLLALSYFPPAVAVPITLAMLYQQPMAAIVGQILRRTERTPTRL